MRSPIPLDLGGLTHGLSGYTKGGCGCDVCKAAKMASNKRWYDKQDLRELNMRRARSALAKEGIRL